MKDEYNEFIPANDSLPANLFGNVTITNDYGISDLQTTAENSSAAEISEGGGKTTAAANAPSGSASGTAASAITKAAVSTNVIAIASAAIVTVSVVAAIAASAPLSAVSGVKVARYSYGNEVSVEFSLTDDENELEDYIVWLEPESGEQIICTVTAEDGLYTATAALTESADGGLTMVVYAYTYEGWEGEIYRGAIELPAAPEFYADDIGFSGYYDDVEGGYAEIGMAYGGSEDIISYSYWLEDEDGQKYELEIYSLDGGYIDLVLSFDPETSPALDIYGRLSFVVSAATDGGWEGEVYREKYILCYDGYLTYPEAYSVIVSYYPHDYYVYISVDVCDPDGIWSALTLSLTDADGQVITVALDETSENISTETDDNYITYYYIDLNDTLITYDEYGEVIVTITATWLEPDGNGGYLEEYTTIVYDCNVAVD